MKRKVLLLGDPALYEVSSAVTREELEELRPDIEDMFECLKDAGFGHGISAPQIGIKKRLICLDLDGVRRVIVNPTLELVGSEMMELMDDCLCFPGLLVKVRRRGRAAGSGPGCPPGPQRRGAGQGLLIPFRCIYTPQNYKGCRSLPARGICPSLSSTSTTTSTAFWPPCAPWTARLLS